MTVPLCTGFIPVRSQLPGIMWESVIGYRPEVFLEKRAVWYLNTIPLADEQRQRFRRTISRPPARWYPDIPERRNYILSTVTRTRSPALRECPFGISILNHRAPGLSWVGSCAIRQSFLSLISATNSISDSNSRTFSMIKREKYQIAPRGVTIHVVLFE